MTKWIGLSDTSYALFSFTNTLAATYVHVVQVIWASGHHKTLNNASTVHIIIKQRVDVNAKLI